MSINLKKDGFTLCVDNNGVDCWYEYRVLKDDNLDLIIDKFHGTEYEFRFLILTVNPKVKDIIHILLGYNYRFSDVRSDEDKNKYPEYYFIFIDLFDYSLTVYSSREELIEANFECHYFYEFESAKTVYDYLLSRNEEIDYHEVVENSLFFGIDPASSEDDKTVIQDLDFRALYPILNGAPLTDYPHLTFYNEKR